MVRLVATGGRFIRGCLCHGAAAVRRRWRVRFPSKPQLRLNKAGTGGTSTSDQCCDREASRHSSGCVRDPLKSRGVVGGSGHSE